ncbi:MAG: STAS/SEC14 domain-containing protein [Flavobacteriales bacterium]|nr:STAS/SEC14 domain-containing protein [Flavobacteriales bacterium]MEB2340655.1 STAS/SEC14 domain-containing protein [Flavobacteriia bacterium]
MSFTPKEARTRIAELRVTAPDLLEIRYDRGIIFSPEAIAETQAKRRELMGDRRYATLTIIPADVDYAMESMAEDQGRDEKGRSQIIASAVVAGGQMIELLTRLYLSTFPQRQMTFITSDEQAAREWLATKLEQEVPKGT